MGLIRLQVVIPNFTMITQNYDQAPVVTGVILSGQTTCKTKLVWVVSLEKCG